MSIREQRILDLLDRKSAYTYRELERLLCVSSMTIRRDVQRLAKRDLLIKALGGVQRAPAGHFLHEASLLSRSGIKRMEKRAIAMEAAKLIQANQTLLLDGGSTCIEFARHIAKSGIAVTVITNSVVIAMELGQARHVTVVCLGGEYDATSACLVGTLTEDDAQKFFVDCAFFSTKAFVPTEGTYESALTTLRIKQILASRSSKVILLIDHSKFGQRALRKVLDIESIHAIVTDSAAPPEALEALRERGCQVLVAHMNEEPRDAGAAAAPASETRLAS